MVSTQIHRDVALCIRHDLLSKRTIDCGLLGGDFGKIVYLFYASRAGFVDYDVPDSLLSRMLADNAASTPIMTYCNGVAGMCIGLELLGREDFIENCGNATLSCQSVLAHWLRIYLSIPEIDFLHGAVGLGFYFLRHAAESDISLNAVQSLVDYLWSHAIRDDDGSIYWLYRNKDNQYVQNASISHGISSTAIFLRRAYDVLPDGKAKENTLAMLEGVGRYLMQQISDPKQLGSFTTVYPVGNGSEKRFRSRLGWCYGDIGVSVALRNLGEVLHNDRYKTIALEIATFSAIYRRDPQLCAVFDAGICHGSAGVGQYFKRCHEIYGDFVFFDAFNYWREITLGMSRNNKGLRSFGRYSVDLKGMEQSTNLLEGDSGIGMFLLDCDKFLNAVLLYD
ncbi:MAG: hypothetical protein K2H33_00595 [Muribaculaceae bacterium]|nr:hypothetical protein [Muribaculaceae bacterium]